MDFIVKSLVQATVGLILATVFWGFHRLVARLARRPGEGWRRWLGLHPPASPRLGLALFAVFVVVGAVLPVLARLLVPSYEAVARASPQFAIAEQTAGPRLLAAIAYAFVMTGFTEELLFRGVVAKRLMAWLGDATGNLVQAVLFALLHVVIVYGAVADPGPALVFLGGVLPGAMGWVFGWAMARDGGSLLAPWLAHSAGNLATVFGYVILFR